MSSVNGPSIRARDDAKGESMDRKTVRLPDAQIDQVERLVETGEYPNESEVIRDGLRRLLANRREGEQR